MATDIFDFWAECPPDARIHPRDKPVFERPFIGTMASFDLRCLPTCFAGRLRTAPVVLLYLSPGWKQSDVDEAATEAAQARYAERRKGDQPLDGEGDHFDHFKWWASRTKLFGPSEIVRDKIAFLNLAAYHSSSFEAHHALAALPSSRATLDWAHEILFPLAMNGDKVVVCMRAAAHWGLEPGKIYGQSLYAPGTVRGGHMRKTGEHAEVRKDIIDAIRIKLGVSINP